MSWARRFELRQWVRQSLWVVPLIGSLLGAALARVDLAVEDSVTLPLSWQYTPSTATALLAAVTGAMVGLLGLVVTIGVLVVQMATQTLSPRFMRLWYRDRLQKVTLAAFTFTFTFAYVLLRNVQNQAVPDLGITLAGLIVTIDLIVLLVFLNRFVHALRPVAVGAAMSRAGTRVIEGLRSSTAPRGVVPELSASGTPTAQVTARRSGAIMAMNVRAIARLAARDDSLCVLTHPVGDFVTVGEVMIKVYGPMSPATATKLRGTVALGIERTIEQDPAFALRVIVDVAIRALSPAVNDPTTASQMLDHIGSMLSAMGAWDPSGRGMVLGPDHRVRVLVPTRTWEDYLDLGLTEIRHYGRHSPQTCRRLRALLLDLQDSVPRASLPAVRKHLVALDQAVVESFSDPSDRAFALMSDEQGLGGASVPPGGPDPGSASGHHEPGGPQSTQGPNQPPWSATSSSAAAGPQEPGA